MVFFLLMDLRSDIHKYLRDPRNKKDRILAKIQADHQEPKRGTIESFFDSYSFEKTKGDVSTSTIGESLQITESNETACCSTDESFESPSSFSSSATAATATEIPFIPSYVSCSSKEPSPSS